MFCPSWVNKFVITVAHALTVGPSGILVIASVLLWEHLGQLGVYLLLACGTRRQSHHKVVSRPTSNNGIPNGASFDTAVTIELRFALFDVKCFSHFSLPLPACTIYCLHALPIDVIWHRLFMNMLGNGWLGALSKSNRIAMFLLLSTSRTQSFAYMFTRARFAFHGARWSNLLEVGPSMYKESTACLMWKMRT